MGFPFPHYLPYLLFHCLNLLQHLTIPKPQNTKTSLLEVACPNLIVPRLLPMLPPIYLDDKLLFQADEIENVITERMLSAKLQA